MKLKGEDSVEDSDDQTVIATPIKTPVKVKRKKGSKTSRKEKRRRKEETRNVSPSRSPNKLTQSPTLAMRRGKRGRISQAEAAEIEALQRAERNKNNNRAVSPPLSADAIIEIKESDKALFKTVQEEAEAQLSAIVLTPLKGTSRTLKVGVG